MCLFRWWSGHNEIGMFYKLNFTLKMHQPCKKSMLTKTETFHTRQKCISRYTNPFYPSALKGSGVLSSPERAGGRADGWSIGRAGGRSGGRATGQTSAVNTLTSAIFHGSFWNLTMTFIVLIYVHNWPFNELASFGIPRLISQAIVSEFVTHVGLNMLINISSGFYQTHQKWRFFSHFPTSPIENHC